MTSRLLLEWPQGRVCVGRHSRKSVRKHRAASVARLLETLWGGDETLIVISSDLSHFLPYDVAQQVDAETASRILKLDSPIDGEEACGCRPLNGLLELAREKHLHAELLALCNSGDTAGDKRRVVGYGSFALMEPAPT